MHNQAERILEIARATGLRLWRDGDRIAIAPSRRCTPELLAQIKAHKKGLLFLLDVEACLTLTPDQIPWAHTALQVLSGEFDTGTRSELEAVLIGVRNIRFPVCQNARLRLEKLLAQQRATKKGGRP